MSPNGSRVDITPSGVVPVTLSEASAAEADDEDSTTEKRLVSIRTGRGIKCSLIQESCWFLPLTFGKNTERFLVDSGSEVTLVGYDMFKRNPALRILELRDPGPWQLSGVGGEDVKIRGLISLPITLDGKEYVTDAVVADLGGGTAGIIGMNFLQKHNVTTNFSSGELCLEGVTHFLYRKGPARSFQLRVARAQVLPPHSETIVSSRPRRARMPLDGRACVVQPTATFARDTGCAIGGTLVRSCRGEIPILVVNPTDAPVVLQRGLVAATCGPAAHLKAFPKASPADAVFSPRGTSGRLPRPTGPLRGDGAYGTVGR